MEASYPPALQAEIENPPRPGLLLKDVHNLYRRNFTRWFKITAPTSLIAALLFYLTDAQVRSILRNVPIEPFHIYLPHLAGAFVVRFGGYFLSWLLGCFALAAIATEVNGLNVDDDDAVWRRDSHQLARERFGALAFIAAITYVAFLVGMAAAGIVCSAAVKVVGWHRFAPFNYAFWVASITILTAILSWLGPAIPFALERNTKILAALKKSIESSAGYEGALFLLVAESVLASYLAWYFTVMAMRSTVPVNLRNTSWYGWVVWVIVVLATAAVDPPLFIGFSLLAGRERNLSALPGAEQPPHIH